MLSMGIVENGFRQLTNNVHEIKSVEDIDEWYINQLEEQGYSDTKALVEAFQK